MALDPEENLYEVEELLVQPGTYFNPQTEVVVIVDDSASIDQEVFNMEAYEGAEWVRLSDEVPVDEDGRDRVLEAFQTHYHPGSTGSVSETALEQGDDELDEDEEGQEPGREDVDGAPRGLTRPRSHRRTHSARPGARLDRNSRPNRRRGARWRTTITEHEAEQVEKANATGKQPVVFVHGLWLLPNSWDRWAAVFKRAGYVTLTPGWPDDPETVAEAKEHPEVFAKKSIGQIADHFDEVIQGPRQEAGDHRPLLRRPADPDPRRARPLGRLGRLRLGPVPRRPAAAVSRR